MVLRTVAQARCPSNLSIASAFKRGTFGKQPPVPFNVHNPVGHAQKVAQYMGCFVKHVSDEDVLILATEMNQPEVSRDDIAHQTKEAIEAALPTSKGAILFKGLPIDSPKTCSDFVKGLKETALPYEYGPGLDRDKEGEDLYIANIPADLLLDLHNELVFNPRTCKKFIMVNLKQAPEGGESLVASSAEIASAVGQDIIDLFEAKGGVKYYRHYPSAEQLGANMQTEYRHMGNPTVSGKTMMVSWQQRTGCDTRAEAEEHFRRLGCHTEWNEDGSFGAWNVKPAVVPDPATGQPLWFNMAHAANTLPFQMRVTFGNGEVIGQEVVDAIVRARVSATRAFKMEAGDMLVLDNDRYLHGRLPYSGDRIMVGFMAA